MLAPASHPYSVVIARPRLTLHQCCGSEQLCCFSLTTGPLEMGSGGYPSPSFDFGAADEPHSRTKESEERVGLAHLNTTLVMTVSPFVLHRSLN